MPNVEFSEEQAYSTAFANRERTPVQGLRALPIRLGLAKDEKGADMVLVGIAILAIVLGLAVFLYSARATPSQNNFPGGSGGVPIVPSPAIQP